MVSCGTPGQHAIDALLLWLPAVWVPSEMGAEITRPVSRSRGTFVADETRIKNTFGYFYGWHNTESHDMPSEQWPKYYVEINNTWREHGVSAHLSVVTPISFAYLFSLNILGTSSFSSPWWSMPSVFSWRICMLPRTDCRAISVLLTVVPFAIRRINPLLVGCSPFR